MNEEMRRIEAEYVGRLRASMRGMTPDAIEEVEREIRAHIEDALAARALPTVGAMLDVLERLGPPEDYAPDLGLYMMVDRGYREWSVPHMLRSTAFWSSGNLTGAVALLSFGALVVGALGLVVAGLLRAAPETVFELLTGVAGQEVGRSVSPSAIPLLVAGLLALGAVMALVRWFVGVYVRRARPSILGGEAADGDWVRRASRRIVAVAVLGLATAGLAVATAGNGVPGGGGSMEWSSPLAVVAGLGVATFLLAPVLGLLWSTLVER